MIGGIILVAFIAVAVLAVVSGARRSSARRSRRSRHSWWAGGSGSGSGGGGGCSTGVLPAAAVRPAEAGRPAGAGAVGADAAEAADTGQLSSGRGTASGPSGTTSVRRESSSGGRFAVCGDLSPDRHAALCEDSSPAGTSPCAGILRRGRFGVRGEPGGWRGVLRDVERR